MSTQARSDAVPLPENKVEVLVRHWPAAVCRPQGRRAPACRDSVAVYACAVQLWDFDVEEVRYLLQCVDDTVPVIGKHAALRPILPLSDAYRLRRSALFPPPSTPLVPPRLGPAFGSGHATLQIVTTTAADSESTSSDEDVVPETPLTALLSQNTSPG